MNSRDVVPEGMNPVSPHLTKARYIVNISWMVILAVAAAVAGYFLHWSLYILAGVFVALIFWLLWLIPAQVKLMGWQETEDELLITKGRLWHRFTVVPYGRIQFVDVSSGPIARIYGLKRSSCTRRPPAPTPPSKALKVIQRMPYVSAWRIRPARG